MPRETKQRRLQREQDLGIDSSQRAALGIATGLCFPDGEPLPVGAVSMLYELRAQFRQCDTVGDMALAIAESRLNYLHKLLTREGKQ